MMQFFAEGIVAKKRAALFGAENGVNQNLCEGLGHDGIVVKMMIRFNPFRVDKFGWMLTQGSSFLATLG
jgi:hypothetical protein